MDKKKRTDAQHKPERTVTDGSGQFWRAETTGGIHHPTHIGRYRILGVLGTGGMGVVYRAEQDQPKRFVALKVIKPGVTNASALRRFEMETQILGLLQHHGIAQVYEAGTADSGDGPQPYFAMEYVSGAPLTRYATHRRLNVAQRLELMARVCEAVHYAHQKGVIHRDLKPSNILVTDTGQPKILDFGIARATETDIHTTTLQTQMGQLVGTLSYMSPEQVLGDRNEIDTRSDVYALGVITYELLSGRLPHDVRDRSVPEAVRAIREDEPSRLASVSGVYRGDVETIVAKALDKERTRRYQSAIELASDIRRFLNDQPIVARPPSAAYQLRKFAKRNKALVGGVAAVMVALWIAAIGTGVGLARARTEAAKSQEVVAFLRDTFLSVDPSRDGREVRVFEVLERAVQRLDDAGASTPDAEHVIRNTIAEAFYALGLYEQAKPQFASAVNIARESLGPADEQTLRSTARYASCLRRLGASAEAADVCAAALAVARQAHGDQHTITLEVAATLTAVQLSLGQVDDAEALLHEILETCRRAGREDDPMVANALSNLATLHWERGEFDEAERVFRQLVENDRRTKGPDHEDTLTSMGNLSATLQAQRRFDEAEEIGRRTYEIRKRRFGGDHLETLISLNNLASLMYRQEKMEEAERLMRQSLSVSIVTLGRDHPQTMIAAHNLGHLLLGTDRLEEAEDVLGQLVRALPADDAPEPNWRSAAFKMTYGRCLTRLGRFQQAEPILLNCHGVFVRSFGEEHPRAKSAAAALADLYEQWGKTDRATQYRGPTATRETANQP